jgi:NADP-dependent 3-hydroxy acid dehydrogenase YdfG
LILTNSNLNNQYKPGKPNQANQAKYLLFTNQVANAGIVVSGNIETLTAEQYDWQMDVNLKSVFSLIKLVLPELKKSKGNIIAISSIGSMKTVILNPFILIHYSFLCFHHLYL